MTEKQFYIFRYLLLSWIYSSVICSTILYIYIYLNTIQGGHDIRMYTDWQSLLSALVIMFLMVTCYLIPPYVIGGICVRYLKTYLKTNREIRLYTILIIITGIFLTFAVLAQNAFYHFWAMNNWHTYFVMAISGATLNAIDPTKNFNSTSKIP